MPQTSIDTVAKEYAARLADFHPVVASETGLVDYADTMPDYLQPSLTSAMRSMPTF